MNKKKSNKNWNEDDRDLAQLIEEITVDAYTDDEKIWAFRQVIEDEVNLPADGFVMDEPVRVLEIDYDGNERRGLTATCRRPNGSKHFIAAADVTFPKNSAAARYIDAYRKWLGLKTDRTAASRPIRKPRHKAEVSDLDVADTLELGALSVKQRAARCLVLGTERIVTFRASGLWKIIPGEIVTVKPRKQWSYAGHPYLSGNIISARLEVKALGLVPLRLEDVGPWNPAEHYWGEEGEPLEDWAKPIALRGSRPAFVMEQVIPGCDTDDDPFSDPISESNDLRDAGQHRNALEILMHLCESDLRCLDAHAHLGNFAFNGFVKDAIRHFEVGVRIGELSLGQGFDGVLEWGHVDNRSFLRCLHGYGLCLWRLGRTEEAVRVFNRMLWMNPSDNQGVRFLIQDIEAGRSWEASAS